MDIRTVIESDLQELAEMNLQLIGDEGHRNSMSVEELRKRMGAWLQANYYAAIIENDSDIVGYTLWREENEYLYIRQFFIRKEKRRNKFGKKAIEFLKNNLWHGKTLRLEVLINNQVARLFWHDVGLNEYCLTMECKNA
jgi:hypothetical protein